MNPKDVKKFTGKNHTGHDSTAPYPVSRMAPSFELVDLAREIAKADAQIQQHLNGKLAVIAEQIRQLQQQAKTLLESAKTDQQLHRAKCNFQRMPGKIYHLYQKPDNSLYFSMLSPQEWGNGCPHTYQGSYRLEADMSWSKIESTNAESATEKPAADTINALLNNLPDIDKL